MMEIKRPTIVLVLRSGGDFAFRDVELISNHIFTKWKSPTLPRVICLWDKIKQKQVLNNVEMIPMWMDIPGTWSRIQLYAPEMEEYKPFLYIDLDTAVIQSLENIFDLIKDESKFITLEDFWQPGRLATGLVWFPKNCEKTQNIWKQYVQPIGRRMDAFLRIVCKPDLFWQQLTSTIKDFKPNSNSYLTEIPEETNLICFHGKPRIFDAESIKWVYKYIQSDFDKEKKVTVIIPYKIDRGWLQEAIDSVPSSAQLLVSQGDGNWPENFNKVLNKAEGKYIRWLHEDDMLTPNSIQDSIQAIEEQSVDFIHGNAKEIKVGDSSWIRYYTPSIQIPTLNDLLQKNIIHQSTLMYRREVFEKVGRLDETLNVMEEYEFNLRCLKFGLKVGYCNSILGCYRRHSQQKVRIVPESERAIEREMVKNNYR